MDNGNRSILQRAKCWVFTTYFTDPSYQCERFSETDIPTESKYICFQYERCPTTQRLHIQGYVQFNKRMSFSSCKEWVKKLFKSEEPHIEVARGTAQENTNYCSKSDCRELGTEPFMFGQPSTRGGDRSRSYCELRDRIFNGESPNKLLESDDNLGLLIRYKRTWDDVFGLRIKPREPTVAPVVVLCIGPPGTGKTKWAYEQYPGSYIKYAGKWWDFYCGESTVIYDDFDGCFMQFGDFKRIFDRYLDKVEKKGGSIIFAATTHIITTNVYPSHWWSKRTTGATGRDAIWRRFTRILEFTQEGEPPTEYDPANYRLLHAEKESEDPKAYKD